MACERIIHMYDKKVSFKLRNAVRKGRIIKPNICSDCNKVFDKKYLHGHHTDYSKPFKVKWLCISCHDKYRTHHDTRGEKNAMSKLTNDDVRNIRKLIKDNKLTQKEIAKPYNIARTAISRIKRGIDWKHIK